MTHDIWLTEFPEEKRFVSITYINPDKKPIKFNAVVLKNYIIGGYEYFAMYHLDNFRVRILDLNSISFVNLMEDTNDLYTIDEFKEISENERNKVKADNLIEKLIEKNFVRINIDPDIHIETRDLIYQCAGIHMSKSQFGERNYIYVKKSKLPILMLRDATLYNEIVLPIDRKLKALETDKGLPLANYQEIMSWEIKEINTIRNKESETNEEDITKAS